MSCIEQTTSKYLSRPSPPYPAQECRGKVLTGNDGKLYKSVPAVTGVYRWVRADAVKSKKAEKGSKSVKKSSTRKGGKKSSKGGKKASRKGSKKGSKKSRKGSKKSRKGSKKSRKGSKKLRKY